MSIYDKLGSQICENCNEEIYDLNNSPDSNLCIICYCDSNKNEELSKESK